MEQPLSALVVDDNPRWRELVSDILREAGWRVTSSAEPPADLAGYRLAVLDIALSATAPGNRDGLLLLDRLSGGATRCVLLSGLADDDEVAAAVRRRPNVLGLIHKDDFDRDDFRELVGPAAELPRAADRPHVLVVEDDAGWRAVYAGLLTEAGYAPQFAASYGEARGLLQRAAFALAVVDLQLVSSTAPEENRDGFWLLRAARQRNVPTMVVSALGAPEDIDRAYDEFGVFAFVEKEAFDRRAFARLVAEAVRPGSPAAPQAGAESLPPDLTGREREVLALLTRGLTNRQIGEALLITPNTVKKHVDHILQKLGVSNRAAAVAVALKAGLN